MKLIFVIVRDEDSFDLLDSLINSGFQVTKISSTGGFLKLGNTTLLLGVEEDRIEAAKQIIEKNMQGTKYIHLPGHGVMNEDLSTMLPIEYSTGGATIFILNVERFIKF